MATSNSTIRSSQRCSRMERFRKGWVIHIAGPTDTGWRIVNVVPSQEEFEAFAAEKLGPTLQQVEGVTPTMTFFPVYKIIEA